MFTLEYRILQKLMACDVFYTHLNKARIPHDYVQPNRNMIKHRQGWRLESSTKPSTTAQKVLLKESQCGSFIAGLRSDPKRTTGPPPRPCVCLHHWRCGRRASSGQCGPCLNCTIRSKKNQWRTNKTFLQGHLRHILC